MNWKKIIVCIFVVSSFVLFNYFYTNNNAKLTCFRKNGDKVIITFDKSGINKIHINYKEMEESEAELYRLNFKDSFSSFSSDYDKEELLSKYIEEVKKYEENNEATCK